MVPTTEKPSIDMSKLNDITVRAGQDLKIVVPIKGWPTPTASWELNGEPIIKGGRVNMEVNTFQCLHFIF